MMKNGLTSCETIQAVLKKNRTLLNSITLAIVLSSTQLGFPTLTGGAAFAASPDAQARQDKAAPVELAAYYAPPSIKGLSVSPDGKHIVYLKLTKVDASPDVPVQDSYSYAVIIAKADNLKAKPVYTMQPSDMQASQAVWVSDKRIVLTMSQELKPGNYLRSAMAYKTLMLDIETFETQELPPKRSLTRSDRQDKAIQRNRISVIGKKPNSNNEYLISWNDTKTNEAPIFELNVDTGKIKKVARQRTALANHKIDLQGNIRLASSYKRRVRSYYGKLQGSSKWQLLLTDALDDKTGFEIMSFVPGEPNQLYVKAYQENNYLGVHIFDMETKSIIKEVFTPTRGDVYGIVTMNVDGVAKPIGVTYAAENIEFEYFDTSSAAIEYKALMEGLHTQISEYFRDPLIEIVSSSSDGNLKIIDVTGVDRAGAYFLLRNGTDLEYIASKAVTLDDTPRNPMTALTYEARDGLEIEGFLTRPNGTKEAGPTIIMPHGGPWARDFYSYDFWADMLASRGYNVFRPNYRGSVGYGRALWQAGDGQWGYTMQDDLDDAAAFLVDQGIADPKQLIMYGYSYGGYAAMVAPVRDNPPYVCAIAGAGVSNMATIRKETWEGSRALRTIQFDAVDGLSPDKFAEKASIPLLILHGEHDIIVPVSQGVNYAKKLKKFDKDVKLVTLPHMAHQANTWSYGSAKRYYTELFDFLDKKCQAKP